MSAACYTCKSGQSGAKLLLTALTLGHPGVEKKFQRFTKHFTYHTDSHVDTSSDLQRAPIWREMICHERWTLQGKHSQSHILRPWLMSCSQLGYPRAMPARERVAKTTYSAARKAGVTTGHDNGHTACWQWWRGFTAQLGAAYSDEQQAQGARETLSRRYARHSAQANSLILEKSCNVFRHLGCPNAVAAGTFGLVMML